jgi:protein-disulfide isomerase
MKLNKNIFLPILLILLISIFYTFNIVNKKKNKSLINQDKTNTSLNNNIEDKNTSNIIKDNKQSIIDDKSNSNNTQENLEKNNINQENNKIIETNKSLDTNNTKESNKEILDETNKSNDIEKEQKEASQEDYKKKVFTIKKFDLTMGNKDSDIQIFEYTSVTCPHCKKFHDNIFSSIKNEYIKTNKVFYILRDFPTDPISFRTSIILRQINNLFDNDKLLSLRSLIMNNQDKIIKAIYDNKSNPKEAFNEAVKILKKIFEVSAGISESKFDEYINFELENVKLLSDAMISEIDNVEKLLGSQAGAPTFLIFNKKTGSFTKIEGIRPIEEWRSILNEIS